MNRLLCFLFGHLCEPTGRRGIVLREWRCERCGGLYISHRDYGNAIVPADEDSDRMLSDERQPK